MSQTECRRGQTCLDVSAVFMQEHAVKVMQCISQHSNLLSKNIEIKYKELQFCSFFLDGCETWLLTMREEHKLWFAIQSTNAQR